MYFPKYTSVTTLTAAQIKTLHTAPVLFAPGRAGCIVDIKSCVVVYHHGSQAFNPASGDQISAITGALPNSFAATGFFAQGFCDQATDQIAWVENWWGPGDGTGSAVPLSDVVGSGIYLFQFNVNVGGWPNGSNWTLGNGTFTVYTEYSYLVA